jgi:NAD(P)-dependent dehydrogenase (short-subunit alcohol dehydrogenase family)
MTEQEWDGVIQVHLRGTFAPARHAAAYWRAKAKAGEQDGGTSRARSARGGGRLITTSSSTGLFGNIGQTNYAAAKAGIAAFTVTAAKELGRYGVTANCVNPGAASRLTADLTRYKIVPGLVARAQPNATFPMGETPSGEDA